MSERAVTPKDNFLPEYGNMVGKGMRNTSMGFKPINAYSNQNSQSNLERASISSQERRQRKNLGRFGSVGKERFSTDIQNMNGFTNRSQSQIMDQMNNIPQKSERNNTGDVYGLND